MADRPILMSAPMVRAILAGTKTQTRRPMKNPPTWNTEHQPNGWQWNGRKHGEPALSKWPEAREIGKTLSEVAVCPYGQPGDRLWVREAWAAGSLSDSLAPSEMLTGTTPIYYLADHIPDSAGAGRGRPSIHMPRWASRITLLITSVRVERLQDISEADAIAEGIELVPECREIMWRDYSKPIDRAGGFGFKERPPARASVLSYRSLWQSINGPYSWDTNHWVWVVEFKRIEAAP
jgi:hypothetical protein